MIAALYSANDFIEKIWFTWQVIKFSTSLTVLNWESDYLSPTNDNSPVMNHVQLWKKKGSPDRERKFVNRKQKLILLHCSNRFFHFFFFYFFSVFLFLRCFFHCRNFPLIVPWENCMENSKQSAWIVIAFDQLQIFFLLLVKFFGKLQYIFRWVKFLFITKLYTKQQNSIDKKRFENRLLNQHFSKND